MILFTQCQISFNHEEYENILSENWLNFLIILLVALHCNIFSSNFF